MTTAINSPADAVNLALVRIGYHGRVGSLYDGSTAAKHALDIYSQTRDQLIRDGDWECMERSVPGTLQKQAPAGGYVGIQWSDIYPCLPWLYQYEYPSDCLKLRSVLATPALVPDFDPQYNVFSLDNDNSFTPTQKVINCNVPDAIFIYAAQVTDPTNWDAAFIEAFTAALGRRLAPVLLGLENAKLAVSDEQAEKQIAKSEKG
jgi:hypothetical protein